MSSSPSSRLSTHNRIRSARKLLLILGDQLDLGSPALAELDRNRDAILMLEVEEEAEHVPSHRQRTVLFLSAMRHFALELIDRGYRLRYVRLNDRGNTQSLGSELKRVVEVLRPRRVVVVKPGEHRVEKLLRESLSGGGVSLDVVDDESFSCSLEDFNAWADDGRKQLLMESFYRQRRRKLGVLMKDNDDPVGGQWNYDKANRRTFDGEPRPPRPYRPRPDGVTQEVIELVERTWPEAPGRLDAFHWPVTRREAKRALTDFIDNRLACFGTYEDAMWTEQPVLYHSLLSSSLNLKLLKPQECVDAAIEAYASGKAEINNVEGFVRQIIGWREYVRGVYYREGADYPRRNGLDHHGDLPQLYWDGETDMSCLSHCLNQVLDRAYGHHIPRLMVIGNFALIAGVRPREVHEWFLGMYVDAVEWVTAPNVVGMSQHADGAIVGTKPYAASGKYIDRMSNYCGDCRYSVKRRSGEGACPFNTFYWDFLIRHHSRFEDNHRMRMVLSNLDRMEDEEKSEITARARQLRMELGIGGISG